MCKCDLWVSAIVFVCSVFSSTCFNVDTFNYNTHKGDNGSMFGFSVTPHREKGLSWIIIGAPKANTQQPQVVRGGAVYKCQTDRDNYCEELPFDRKGDNYSKEGRIDNKSFQWFGATVSSAGDDKPVVACAPRYVWFTHGMDRRDPVGTCYVARDDFQKFYEYSPCRTSQWGYHRQGSCQAGFGAAISNDGRRLFISAPGSWYWQGQMYSIDSKSILDNFPFKGEFGTGQAFQQSLDNRPALLSTREGGVLDDDSYMGYSLVAGDFGNEGVQGIAIGMPRGASLKGKVVVFTWNLTNDLNITGEQLGAYFGYAVGVTDVDGDGRDDLIVGAPLFTESNKEMKYEVGRIYVAYQGKVYKNRFEKRDTLDGFNSKSRFGLAVAGLGDMNLDGYGDFAVGAPYDGPGERGAIYIFHGDATGVRKKYSQVIYSEDLGGPRGPFVSTFGFSIAGGVDLDRNDYPDMVVGAYLSDTVYYFRSRPVVRVDAFVQFLSAHKQIVLEQKNCTIPKDGKLVPVSCTAIKFCMKYNGIGVPNTREFDVSYVLDVRKRKDPRMYFLDYPGNSVFNEFVTLRREGDQICKTKSVYIKNELRDKLTPLEAEVRYTMRTSRSVQSAVRNPRSHLLPVLDLDLPPFRNDSINIHKNCGPDNVCIPNLSMEIKSNVTKILLGSHQHIQIDVLVINSGEDAFETTFDLQLPPGIDFNQVNESATSARVLCDINDSGLIHCDIGNPLPAHRIARFVVYLKPYYKEGMSSRYDFHMKLNSSNPETLDNQLDNRHNLTIPLWVDAKLQLSGSSRPADIYYQPSSYSDKIKREGDVGPQVIHLYTVKNLGPSSFNSTEILIIWPSQTLGGDDFLYLLEQPHTKGNIHCLKAPANYRNYDLDYRSKSIWETIGIEKSQPGTVSAQHLSTGDINIEKGTVLIGTPGLEKVDETKNNEKFSGGDTSHVYSGRYQNTSFNINRIIPGTVIKDTIVSFYNTSRDATGMKTNFYTKNTTTVMGPEGQLLKRTERITRGPQIEGLYGSSGSGITETKTFTRTFILGSDGKMKVIEKSSGGAISSNAEDKTNINNINEGSTTTYQITKVWNATNIGGGKYRLQLFITNITTITTQDGRKIVTKDVNPSEFHEVTLQELQEKLSQLARSATYKTETFWNTTYNSEQTPITQVYVKNITTVTNSDGTVQTYESVTPMEQYQGTFRNRQGGQNVQSTHREYDTKDYSQLNYGTSVNSVQDKYKSVKRPVIVSTSSGGGFEDVNSYNQEVGIMSSHTGRTSGYNANDDINARQYSIVGRTNTAESGGVTERIDAPYPGNVRDNSSHFGWNSRGSNVRGQQQESSFSHVDYGHSSSDHGYQHQPKFDIGPITGNIDHSISNHDAQNSGIGYWDADLRRVVYRPNKSYLHTPNVQYKPSRTSQEHNDEYSSYHGSYNHIDRDNVATDRPNHQHGRQKRENANLQDADLQDVIPCKAARCLSVRCFIGPMTTSEDIFIAMRYRLNANTLKNITTSQPITFSTVVLGRITKLPYIGSVHDQIVYQHTIFSNITAPEPDARPDIVPLWVVVLSAVAGTIILLLLIFLLYKCGFFKRNRPSDAPERQPLNRNGHFQHGDEAL